jgi:hypothetical protein
MAKERIAIPKPTKESLLKEYNHRCSICGTNNPHIHHIDENPSNNNLDNLIPLCPNCHGNIHHPTSHISANKLKLFRKYKNDRILSDEFEPLFRRMIFLYNLEIDSAIVEINDCVNELVEFVSYLEKGTFYSQRIKDLIGQSDSTFAFAFVFPVETNYQKQQHEEDGKIKRISYIKRLQENREQVDNLIVELLVFQNWQYKPKSQS